MSTSTLQNSLLRPPILHILRAAGFQASRQAAVDSLVDIASRYLCLLASQTATHAFINHNDLIPTVTDVRMALEDVGALSPQIGAMEEQSIGEEDTRGMNAFLKWMMGSENKEIRRIAELSGAEGEVDIEAGAEKEDYLTVLKKKHSKTGEESRFQGTALGKGADVRQVKVEGGHIHHIESWENKLREHKRTSKPHSAREPSSAPLSSAGSPLSDIQHTG
ncbi:hypothetical protein MMC30_006374 [Trapelia coarctata]|nr:hypothetical protein [Trapelia coarctata]